MKDLARAREQMIAEQIVARGVRDKRVVDAMSRVRRELFVPDDLLELAYADMPLPIGEDQTISQPFVVALMVEALGLGGTEKVLEIGAGSGYAAAVLAELSHEVYAIERIGPLATIAAKNLRAAGYDNVHMLHADGSRGWIDEAPFDAILVSAGAPAVPESLKSQLVVGGRMVLPVGTSQHAQQLIRITRGQSQSFDVDELARVRFVPLVGEHGWEDHGNAAQVKRPASER